MKKHEANKLIVKGNYLLNKTILLKNPHSKNPMQEIPFVVKSFGAAKVYFETNIERAWYEIWANLEDSQTGRIYKMNLDKLIRIFPAKIFLNIL
ncbi:MAG: hypothetical protein JNJ41_12230 [Bacteroidia bacterium]|jgi:hypothetical protein|nr:hypothetical protein [Bacteroidia bacterium]MDO9187360.1 hypothetical protein [Bacteroidia bacterium]